MRAATAATSGTLPTTNFDSAAGKGAAKDSSAFALLLDDANTDATTPATADPVAAAAVPEAAPVAPADIVAADPVTVPDPVSRFAAPDSGFLRPASKAAADPAPADPTPKASAQPDEEEDAVQASPVRKRSVQASPADLVASAIAMPVPPMILSTPKAASAPTAEVARAPAAKTSARPVPTPVPQASSAQPSAADAEMAPILTALQTLPGLTAAQPAATPAKTVAAPVQDTGSTVDRLMPRAAVVPPTPTPTPAAPPQVADAPAAPVAAKTQAVASVAAKPTRRTERKTEDMPETATQDAAPPAAAPVVPPQAETPTRAAMPDAPQQPGAAAQLAAGGADRQITVAKHAAWADGIARDIASAGATTGTARFSVAPQSLGTVQVALKRDADGTDVTLTASSATAQAVLADAKPQLIAEAKAQGLHIRDAQIDLGRSAGGGTQENRHSPAQQPAMTADQPRTANAPSTISLTDGGYGGGVGSDAGRQTQQQAQPAPQATVRTPRPVPQAAEPAPVRERVADGRYA